jgi:hypothetical protein
VPAAAREAAQRRFLLRNVDATHVDRDPALPVDRVARVHGEIHDDAFELSDARAHSPDVLLQRRLQSDPWTKRAAEQRQQLGDDSRRVDRADRELLAPRERHQLLDELAAALPRITRRFELLEDTRPLPHLLADQVEVADEHREQIVEVVCDTGRQAAERLHSRAVLRCDAQRLVAVAVDEDTDEA